MELMTSWERKGRAEGRAEGQLVLLKLQLKRRFGGLSQATAQRLSAQSEDDLSRLGEALLDFKSAADLKNWLAEKKRLKAKA